MVGSPMQPGFSQGPNCKKLISMYSWGLGRPGFCWVKPRTSGPLGTQQGEEPSFFYSNPSLFTAPPNPVPCFVKHSKRFVAESTFRKALNWIKRIAAACLPGLHKAAEAIWRVLKGFCSSLEQFFKSLIQV
ncbi:hypothetical protein Celaphus_00006834 [Cervus elaphus hippelaphus]|uniref:Uncharacterized protein n=1 Tax=Cervus elaphus hippelaphus TaxID=46360 RepID=A0A212CZ60_CEREH|nr:hypothetical protein Celaphus_00006834 [Cervus elaphus hippelaphus]